MIAIIDYNAGDLKPYEDWVKKQNAEVVITKREMDICKARHIIVPGLGDAAYAMKQLCLSNLSNLLRILKKPYLGVCLGAQILCEKSDEGNAACLGVIQGTVTKLPENLVKLPHKQPESVKYIKPSRLFDGIEDFTQFDYDHSYYIPVNEFTAAVTTYGVEFSAVIEKNNFYGLQFHPERSGDAGDKLLNNFLKI